MLCQFRFKNYKSYRDDAILDMTAANIEEFSDTLLPAPGEKFSQLLPIAVIYGPNAGGKSNAISALAYLISRVSEPIFRSTGVKNPFGMVLQGYSPFLFDEESRKKPTEFEITFRTNHAQYNYTLSILDNNVYYESLNYIKFPCTRRRTVMLFQRSTDEIVLGTALKKRNKQKVSPSIPFLSFLAINYDIFEINDAVNWFQNCIIENYAIPDSDHRFASLLMEPGLKKSYLTLLSAMDIPITDIVTKEDSLSEDDKAFQIIATHTVNGKQYNLDLGNESEGTQKILSALPGISYSLAIGGLVLFDEFDAKLHPKLLRFIIDAFTNPEINQSNAQLVFSCHDVSIMKNDYLRRDEIWFAATNQDSSSELWCLYDILDENGNHVKNTTAYDKQYLTGRYGADPYLDRMRNWGSQNA